MSWIRARQGALRPGPGDPGALRAIDVRHPGTGADAAGMDVAPALPGWSTWPASTPAPPRSPGRRQRTWRSPGGPAYRFSRAWCSPPRCDHDGWTHPSRLALTAPRVGPDASSRPSICVPRRRRPAPSPPGTGRAVGPGSGAAGAAPPPRRPGRCARRRWAVASAASLPPRGTRSATATRSASFRRRQNGRKRLVGCLEDATLDRVVGHVRSIATRHMTRFRPSAAGTRKVCGTALRVVSGVLAQKGRLVRLSRRSYRGRAT